MSEWLEKPLSESERVNLLAEQTDRPGSAKKSKKGTKKKKNQIENVTTEEIQNEVEGDSKSGSIDPVNDLTEGESRTVAGSKGEIYTVRREGNKIYCTCKGWQFQKGKIESKTCKHIQSIRGIQAEMARTGQQIKKK